MEIYRAIVRMEQDGSDDGILQVMSSQIWFSASFWKLV